MPSQWAEIVPVLLMPPEKAEPSDMKMPLAAFDEMVPLFVIPPVKLTAEKNA